MPSQLLLVRGARQLLTLRGAREASRGAALGDLGLVENGSILIRDGFIAQVGSARRLENLKEARGATQIAVKGALVMPGFVDPSIHLQYKLAAPGNKQKSTTTFFDDALKLLRSCQQHGTLNAQVTLSTPYQDLRSILSLLKQLADIGKNLVGTMRTWRISDGAKQTDSAQENLPAAMREIAKRKLVQTVEVAPDVRADARDEIWSAARGSGLETNLLWPGDSAAHLADLLTRVRPRAISSVLTLNEAECTLLSRCSCPIVLAPVRSIAGDRLIQAAAQLIRDGGAIAIASGYDEQEMPVLNMQAAVSLAVLRLGLSAEQAISAATINAAYAVGLGDELGSLEVGKRADLLVLNLSDYRELPRNFGVNNVDMVIREGKVLSNRPAWKVGTA